MKLIKLLISLTAATAVIIPIIIACSGYSDLGEENDPTTPMGEDSKTYMRTTDISTVNTVELITLEDPVNDRGQIDIIQIDDDIVGLVKTVVMIRGTYRISGGTITLYPEYRYEGDYKQKDPLTSSGSTREEYTEGFSTNFSYDSGAGPPPTVTIGGFTYTSFPGVLETVIGLGDQERAEKMMLLADLSMIHSQIKIKGFGGKYMSEYFGEPSTFKGVRTGTYDLSLSGTTTVTSSFEYDNYSDYQGLQHNNTQRSTTNRNGNGSMSGTVNFTATGSSTTVQGSVDFSNIDLEATVSNNGYYLVSVDTVDDTQVAHDVTNPGNPVRSYLHILPEIPTEEGKLSLPPIQ
jgi:hypothetical protein